VKSLLYVIDQAALRDPAHAMLTKQDGRANDAVAGMVGVRVIKG